MNPNFYKLTARTRLLCILMVITLGLVSIIGSGGNSGSSPTEYETLYPTFNFETINVSYDGTSAATESCTLPTTMAKEAQKAYPDETRDIRIVDWTLDALEVKYENAIWSSLGSLQTIICVASLEGSKGSGDLDITTVQLGSSDWSEADNSTVFTNYLNEPNAEFELCVFCRDSNLFNNYRLDYKVRMDLTLIVAYDDVESATTE